MVVCHRPRFPICCWQAVENVGDVLAQLLRVQSRLEANMIKLKKLNTSEAKQQLAPNDSIFFGICR